MSTVNAPLRDPVNASDLALWLGEPKTIRPGVATLSVYAFFVEVPTDWQVEFLEYHGLNRSAVMAVADEFVRPQIVGGLLPIDSAQADSIVQ